MRKQAEVELLVPSRQRRRDSFGRAIEDLLVFEARMLDRKDRQELLRLLPGLLHASRYWAARFAEKGCLCCHRKKVPYGAGGLCERCQAREYHGMREWYSKRFAGRDLDKEVSALSRRFDAAQMLFNGGDE